MQSYKVSGTIAPEELKNLVEEVSSQVENFVSYPFDGTVITVIGAGKYYMRTNDTVGFYMFSVSKNSEQRIDFSSAGGGSGLLNLNLGSKKKYEEEIASALDNLVQGRGLTMEKLQ